MADAAAARSWSSAPACSVRRSGWRCAAATSRCCSATATPSTSGPRPGSAPASAHAGEPAGLVVVAVPPDHVGAEVARALRRRPTRSSPTSAASRPPRCARSTGVAGHRAVRRRPPDGGQRAVRAAGGQPRPCSTAGPWAVTPARRTPTAAATAAVERAGPPGRRERRTAEPGGARPGRRPHLPPAAPAGRPGRRPAGRRARRPPRAERPGRPRRHPDRRGRPGALAADRHRERRRPWPGCSPRYATSSTS